jgi:TolB protein
MREQNGQNDLFTAALDGSGVVQLTDDSAVEMSPVWSPDGTQIAYQRTDETGEREIYLMNADGSGARNLTNHPGEDRSPAWSPDGEWIAFASSYGNSPYPMSVYLISPDGGTIEHIPNTEGADSPRWSPDGTQIVFRKELPRNDEIFVVNLDGSGLINLTNNPVNDVLPDWSPDGSANSGTANSGTILFESTIDGSEDIYAVNPDGSNQRRFTTHPLGDEYPRWSPDGTVILYTHHGTAYIMNPDGSDQRPLFDASFAANFASWKPCGQ